jgi:hypothetical protein
MTKVPIPTLSELLGAISSDVRTLASQTVMLARLEMSGIASNLAWSLLGVVASIVVALAGAGVLVSALVLIGIALGLPAWAAAVVVGTLLTAGGALSARYFLGRARRVELGLKETRESFRETLEWLRLQTGN